MRKLSMILTLALAMVFGVTAGAAPISGSLVLGTLGATGFPAGSDLLTGTVFTPVFMMTGIGDGDYPSIPLATPATGGVVDLNALTTFLVNVAGYGSFSATSGSIVDQQADFLEVLYSGTFGVEAGGALDALGLNDSAATFRVSLNKSGNSISYGATLDSSTPEVPEPGTWAMLVAGLLSLGILRRKRS